MVFFGQQKRLYNIIKLQEYLQITQGISLRKENVPLNIHPKSYYKIDNNRAAEGEKGGIDEIEPDFAGGNTELFANSGTYPKGIIFNKMAET